MDIRQFEERKRDHIRLALDLSNQAIGGSGLDQIRLLHEALPELDFAEVRLEGTSLGKSIRNPFFVSGMTAGHHQAAELNLKLALACQARGWAMGVGSQRRELETGQLDGLDRWQGLREKAPDLVLMANLGITQLVTLPTLARVKELLSAMGASALVIHANALQEALQPEGTPSFKGAQEALKRACGELGVPVILKETGCGFSARTLSRLRGIGLAAIDVSGFGGTHWGRIEGARAAQASVQGAAAATFADWGIPTVESVIAAREALAGTQTEVWASGGVRTGLDAAKLIALGAIRVGYAKPALEAALQSDEALVRWMEQQEFELKTALFCTGSETPADLRKEGQWTRRT